MNNLFLSTSIHTSTKFLWPKRRIRVTIGLLNAGRGAVSSVLIYGDDFLVEKAFGKLVTGEGLEDLVESNRFHPRGIDETLRIQFFSTARCNRFGYSPNIGNYYRWTDSSLFIHKFNSFNLII